MSPISGVSDSDFKSLRQDRISVGSFLILTLQLSLIILVLWQFQLESRAFFRLVRLTFVGFAVHAYLPMKLRLPFFAGLSVAAIAIVLGVTTALLLIVTGGILIGICHLPISFKVRAAVLIGAGVLLVAIRSTWKATYLDPIWPILGSMFMFRLILYFYELRHDTTPISITQSLSYFFMLPNVCFPLFPVVDFKTFRRNYYDQEAHGIYQVGLDWMARGIVHLILYRFVYLHLTLQPSEVTDLGELGRFMVSTFLLYLRISDQFQRRNRIEHSTRD